MPIKTIPIADIHLDRFCEELSVQVGNTGGSGNSSGQNKSKTLAEKVEALEQRRQKWIVKRLQGFCEGEGEARPARPDLAVVAAVVCAFGVDCASDKDFGAGWRSDWDRLGKWHLQPEGDLLDALWDACLTQLADRLKRLLFTDRPTKPEAKALKWLCITLGYDHKDWRRQSFKALPEPKCWAKQREKEKQTKTDKKGADA